MWLSSVDEQMFEVWFCNCGKAASFSLIWSLWGMCFGVNSEMVCMWWCILALFTLVWFLNKHVSFQIPSPIKWIFTFCTFMKFLPREVWGYMTRWVRIATSIALTSIWWMTQSLSQSFRKLGIELLGQLKTPRTGNTEKSLPGQHRMTCLVFFVPMPDLSAPALPSPRLYRITTWSSYKSGADNYPKL